MSDFFYRDGTLQPTVAESVLIDSRLGSYEPHPQVVAEGVVDLAVEVDDTPGLGFVHVESAEEEQERIEAYLRIQDQLWGEVMRVAQSSTPEELADVLEWAEQIDRQYPKDSGSRLASFVKTQIRNLANTGTISGELADSILKPTEEEPQQV